MWQSKIKIFGMPLISFGFYANGFIAIGFSAVGVITIAQFGVGFIAITQFGIGFFSLAQFTLGFFTLAQFSLGIIAALGAKSVGFIAMGPSPTGYYTIDNIGATDITGFLLLAFDKVAANPNPFIAWCGIWFTLVIFIFLRRGALTLPMSLGDLFRPLIRHSNSMVRLRALGRLDDQEELAAVVRKDPTMKLKLAALALITRQDLIREFAGAGWDAELRAAALAKIDDTGILVGIASSERDTRAADAIIAAVNDEGELMTIAETSTVLAVRSAALRKIKDPDRARVKALAMTTDSLELFHLLADFLDDAALMDIATAVGDMSVAEAAVRRLKNPDEEWLYRLAMDHSRKRTADDAVNRINDQAILERILRADAPLGAKVAAVTRCDNKKLVKEIADTATEELLRNSAKNRLEEIRPLYYSLKLELRCPDCSQPVFVNGPQEKVKCNSCLSSLALGKGFWKAVREASLGVSRDMGQGGLVVEKTTREPVCRQCGAAIPCDDIPAGDTKSIRCPECATVHQSGPLPRWFGFSKNAEHVLCADAVEGSPDTPEERRAPVAISCVKCGAPLEVTVETPRNATCTYCKTVQYLPDGLWLSLHPVKIKRPWYIRCNYRERAIIPKLGS